MWYILYIIYLKVHLLQYFSNKNSRFENVLDVFLRWEFIPEKDIPSNGPYPPLNISQIIILLIRSFPSLQIQFCTIKSKGIPNRMVFKVGPMQESYGHMDHGLIRPTYQSRSYIPSPNSKLHCKWVIWACGINVDQTKLVYVQVRSGVKSCPPYCHMDHLLYINGIIYVYELIPRNQQCKGIENEGLLS